MKSPVPATVLIQKAVLFRHFTSQKTGCLCLALEMKRTVDCNIVRKFCGGCKHRLLEKIHTWVSQRGFLEAVTVEQRILKEEYKPIEEV